MSDLERRVARLERAPDGARCPPWPDVYAARERLAAAVRERLMAAVEGQTASSRSRSAM